MFARGLGRWRRLGRSIGLGLSSNWLTADHRCGFTSAKTNVFPEETLQQRSVSLTAHGSDGVEPTLPDPDPPLLDVPIDVPVVAPDPLSARPHSPKPAAPSIAFQAQDDSSDSSDPSDDEPDLNRINEKWATLMLEMHTLNIAAGAGKKAKKGKSAVVLETPQIRNVKSKLTAVEKEYMFNRKEAGA